MQVFNTLIKLYAKTEQQDLLKGVPHLMVENKVRSDQFTLNSLVAAYVGLGDLREAEAVLRRVKGGEKSESWWGATLRPDVRTYTTMMKGNVQKRRRSDAMRTMLAMQVGNDPRPVFPQRGDLHDGHPLVRPARSDGRGLRCFTRDDIAENSCECGDVQRAAQGLLQLTTAAEGACDGGGYGEG